jgi:hypothetical protein
VRLCCRISASSSVGSARKGLPCVKCCPHSWYKAHWSMLAAFRNFGSTRRTSNKATFVCFEDVYESSMQCLAYDCPEIYCYVYCFVWPCLANLLFLRLDDMTWCLCMLLRKPRCSPSYCCSFAMKFSSAYILQCSQENEVSVITSRPAWPYHCIVISFRSVARNRLLVAGSRGTSAFARCQHARTCNCRVPF